MINPLISIIVPCYNSEKYIAETIESVISQSYNNWEMLITDDCSTDNSVKIITDYMKKDDRIKLFSTKSNTGHPSEPRNISLKNARGDYFALLDSDDIWFPKKLEDQLSLVRKTGASIITSYVQVIDDDSNITKKIIRTRDKSDYTDMLKNNELTAATVFFSKDVSKVLHFPERQQEDYIAWLNVLKHGFRILNTRQIHAYYRISMNSRSSNKLKMLIEKWKILRYNENINLPLSSWYMIIYIYKAVRKKYF